MAMILHAFVGRYMNKLADFAEGEASIILNVKGELRKLQRRLERIGGFLEQAERKRHEDPNIRNWVRELKDIMYDADDIIDLWARLVRGKRRGESVVNGKVMRCLLFGWSFQRREKGKLYSHGNVIPTFHGKVFPMRNMGKLLSHEAGITPFLLFPKKSLQH